MVVVEKEVSMGGSEMAVTFSSYLQTVGGV